MRLEDNDVFHPYQKAKFKGLLREETNIIERWKAFCYLSRING